MWAIQSNLLHPLAAPMSPKVMFKWTDVEHKAFDDINHDVAHNTLLAYPDFKKIYIYVQKPVVTS